MEEQVLKASYERTMDHSFVSFLAPNYEKSFEECMMKNRIEGMLPVRVDYENEQAVFTYDITNKLSLAEYLKRERYHVGEIKRILCQLIYEMKESKKYLLESDNFLIDMDYIFVANQAEEVFLCYYFGYHNQVQNQLTQLFERFMKIIDYSDKKMVQLIYALYQTSKGQTCTYEQILDLLKMNENEVEIPKENETLEKLQAGILEETDSSGIAKEKENAIRPKQENIFLSYIKLAFGILVGVILFAAGMQSGLLQDHYHRMDRTKFICFALIIGVAEFYFVRTVYVGIHKEQADKKRHDKKNGNVYQMKKMVSSNSQCQQTEDSSYDMSIKQQILQKNREISEETDHEEKHDEEGRTEMLYEEGTQLLLLSRKLILVPKKESEEILTVQSEEAQIGSKVHEPDLKILHKTVSRRHAKVMFQDNAFYMEDLNSTNGTFINEERLVPGVRKQISKGDQIRFADISYEVSEV